MRGSCGWNLALFQAKRPVRDADCGPVSVGDRSDFQGNGIFIPVSPVLVGGEWDFVVKKKGVQEYPPPPPEETVDAGTSFQTFPVAKLGSGPVLSLVRT